MSNNRKLTRGRRIQSIDVPETVIKRDTFGSFHVVPNPSPYAGKRKQIQHLPIKKYNS